MKKVLFIIILLFSFSINLKADELKFPMDYKYIYEYGSESFLIYFDENYNMHINEDNLNKDKDCELIIKLYDNNDNFLKEESYKIHLYNGEKNTTYFNYDDINPSFYSVSGTCKDSNLNLSVEEKINKQDNMSKIINLISLGFGIALFSICYLIINQKINRGKI